MFQFFAKQTNEEIYIPNARMHHCSTICEHKNGVMIAFYAGSGECMNDQSVYVSFNASHFDRVGDKTGNPVLWSNIDDTATLLYSRFEDNDKISNIIDRWKYCSLWLQKLKFTNKIEFIGEPVKIANQEQHLLGRCPPLKTNVSHTKLSRLIIPLYNEVRRYGIIYQINDLKTTKMGPVGINMKQPTIWEYNGLLYSLSRNFGSSDTFAKFSYSEDGLTWSKPQKTLIKNNNSSLCVIKWNDDILLLWNDTTKRVRANLTIGRMCLTDFKVAGEILPEIEPICVLSSYGSYPSMCVDKYNRLHMTFTNRNKKIEHHVWNRKYFNKRRRNIARGRGN